ncbi:O-antigen ligase family protein [Halorussus halobius]|uniref:O-antigen ligase family protein n=1 Tax=Halorussus halobius TaxID=1710537 RepID=UPI00109260D7|nr:O-antigen ligase family protein [Halorussus halobius]
MNASGDLPTRKENFSEYVDKLKKFGILLTIATFSIYFFRYTFSRFLPLPPILLSNYTLLPIFILASGLYVYPRLYLPKVAVSLAGLFSLLVVYYGVTAIWSPLSTYAIRKSYLVSIRLLVLFLFCTIVVSSNEKRTKIFYLITLASSLLVTGLLLHEYLVVGEIVSEEFSNHYININRILGLGIILSIFVALKYKRLSLRAIITVTSLINLYLMTQTGGRGPLIAVIGATSIYGIWMSFLKNNNAKEMIKNGIILMGSILCVIFFLFALFDGGKTIIRLTRLVHEPGGSVMVRIDMIVASIGMFAQSPLLGHGAGAFQTLYSKPFQYPHNIFFELLVESGVIGLSLFICYITYILLIIARYGRRDPIQSGVILSLFVFFLLNAFVSSDIPGNAKLFIYSSTVLSLVRTAEETQTT